MAMVKSKQLPKMVINAVYPAVIYNKQLKAWRAESLIDEGVKLLKSQDEIDWFSYPEQHKQTGKLLDGPICL